MIKAIKVVPLLPLKALAQARDQKNPFAGLPWSLIAIASDDWGSGRTRLTAENLNGLKACGMQETLSLVFGDISNEQEARGSNSRLFGVSDAILVLDFLDAMKKRQASEVLVVQCVAGISRSGAIGLFACDYVGFDKGVFAQLNPTINPNPHVSRILNEVRRMRTV